MELNLQTSQYIDTLIKESTYTSDIQVDRPALLSLSKIVSNMTFKELVSVQPTNRPMAAFYGIKGLYDEDGKMTHMTPNTHLGAVQDNTEFELLDTTDNNDLSGQSIVKGTFYKDSSGLQYLGLKDSELIPQEYVDNNGVTPSGQDSGIFAISIGLMYGILRVYNDSASTNLFETSALLPYELDFQIAKWQCETKSRKAQINPTTELLEDIRSNHIDPNKLLEYLLALVMSQEINKDIISKLLTVSTRINDTKLGFVNGIRTIQNAYPNTYHIIGREIMGIIGISAGKILSNTGVKATYALVSKDIYGLLVSGGFLKLNSDKTNVSVGNLNGLDIYVDGYNSFNYVVVGAKHVYNEQEIVAPLFYAPYEDNNTNGISVARNVDDMHERICISSRYALSVNPYASNIDKTDPEYKENPRFVISDDWNKLVGSNLYSVVTMITFNDIQ